MVIHTAEERGERGADSNSRASATSLARTTICEWVFFGNSSITKFGWEHVYFPDLVYDARHFEELQILSLFEVS
jgi:hypothetical protein